MSSAWQLYRVQQRVNWRHGSICKYIWEIKKNSEGLRLVLCWLLSRAGLLECKWIKRSQAGLPELCAPVKRPQFWGPSARWQGGITGAFLNAGRELKCLLAHTHSQHKAHSKEALADTWREDGPTSAQGKGQLKDLWCPTDRWLLGGTDYSERALCCAKAGTHNSVLNSLIPYLSLPKAVEFS